MRKKWIGIDCGKLSIYTTQKRMLNHYILKLVRGKKIIVWIRENTGFRNSIVKNSRGVFLIYEKASKGELVVTDKFMKEPCKIY